MLHSKPVITVTGTNGKGSTVAFCEAILLAAGYKIGAYYSPHVFHSSERVKINNKPISLLDSENFTFQEITHKAIELFNQSDLDALVLEVGIGGRLDAVNLLVEPDVSVITNIDFDHQDKLGHTREEIGLEKAYVYRPNKPSIYGSEYIPESVINYAQKINARLLRYKQAFDYKVYENHWEFFSNNKEINYKNLPIPYLTLHDAAIALEALSHFPLKISLENIQQGLKSAYLPGRFKVISKPVLQIFDVAHNPSSAVLLSQKLAKLPCEGKTIGVVGMLKDKDIPGTLKPLINVVDDWMVGSLDDPRGATCDQVGAYLPNSVLFQDIHEAYQAALKLAGPKDRVVIFGSFRTVGALCPDRS
ncbi:MAG TPA: Mur ligase family protein [Gammaproteobacteria bacterium]|nr:Mur ligase family protein [Gammaproteobacteria bacterium]